jgi:hypothetical protein
LSGNLLDGPVPESIGELVLLEELYIGYEKNSNKFVGPLPSSMSKLILLERLYLNVATLTGPLPDFSQLTILHDCEFVPSGLCRIPEFAPVDSKCDFSILPICESEANPDCVVLSDWLPKQFDSHTCCLVDGVTCEDDHIIILDLSKETTGKNIFGELPSTLGTLENLQELYLQDQFLEGNLPLTLVEITSLKIVDITNNFLSGVVPFVSPFEIIGVETNFDLSLPVQGIDSSTETPKATQEVANETNDSNLVLIVGISAGFLIFLVSIVGALVIILKTRSVRKRKQPPCAEDTMENIRYKICFQTL